MKPVMKVRKKLILPSNFYVCSTKNKEYKIIKKLENMNLVITICFLKSIFLIQYHSN